MKQTTGNKLILIFVATVITICLILTVNALALESDYSKPWCEHMGGHYQYKTTNGTIADCVTQTTAWEVEFADNWYEAVGQSFHYGFVLNKYPGIALIVLNPKDQLKADRFIQTRTYWGWHYLDYQIITSMTYSD